jgi:hypothetical protein
MLTLFNDNLALSFPPTIIDLEVVLALVHIVWSIFFDASQRYI